MAFNQSENNLHKSSECNEIMNPEKKIKLLDRKEDCLTFKFGNGETLQFSIQALASKDVIFTDMLTNLITNGYIDINDFDLESFKLFLDCFAESKTTNNVTEIFKVLQIAKHFGLNDFVSQWSQYLSPKEMNDNIILSLNLSIQCGLNDITDGILSFFKKDTGRINQILNSERYLALMEPKSASLLFPHGHMDSEALGNITKWADNYLKRNNVEIDLKTFLKQYDILRGLKIDNFETTTSLLNFVKSDIGQNHFSSEEIVKFYTIYRKKADRPNFGKWVEMKAGEKLVEKFSEGCCIGKHQSLEVLMYRNPIVFYEIPENIEKLKLVSVKVDHVYYYDGSKKVNITANDVDSCNFSPSRKLVSFPVHHSGKQSDDNLEIECTLEFHAPCKIFKTENNFGQRYKFKYLSKGLFDEHDDDDEDEEESEKEVEEEEKKYYFISKIETKYSGSSDW